MEWNVCPFVKVLFIFELSNAFFSILVQITFGYEDDVG